MPLRIALVGAGKMARAHSQAYLTAARFFDLPEEPVLAVLVGRTPERTEAVARAFGWQRVSCDWMEAISASDVDLVDVCTPNALHATIACAAAAHGRAVVCEKPLATSVPEAVQMTDAVTAAGVANATVFNYRYAPAVRHAHDLITSGAIGQVREFRLHFLQDWLADPSRSMSWRLSAEAGGVSWWTLAHTSWTWHTTWLGGLCVSARRTHIGQANVPMPAVNRTRWMSRTRCTRCSRRTRVRSAALWCRAWQADTAARTDSRSSAAVARCGGSSSE